jgi:hypothetical protein
MGLLAILVHSLFDFNMHIPANALIAVALMAILSSHLRFARSDLWLGLGLPGKLVASLVLLGCVALLGWHSSRRFAENQWLA